MSNRLILFFLLWVPLEVFAQLCSVRGEAKGYEGRKLAVIALQDEFSGKRMLLGQCDVNDNGSFEVQFDPQFTRRVYIHIQRVEAPLYAQPGQAYSVVFPPSSQAEYKRFDNTEVSLQFTDLTESDINWVIRKFNADYASFISNHFYDFATDEYRGAPEYMKYLGSKKEGVDLYSKTTDADSLSKNLEKGFSRWVSHFEDSVARVDENSSDLEFTNTYKRFALAELHLLSGMNRKMFYERYFMSVVPREHNPAFVSCFKLYTRNIVVGQKAPVQSAIIKAVNVDRSLSRLAEALSNESGLLSDRLKQLAALNGLKEQYNNKSFDHASIDILLAKTHSGDSLVDSVAQAILFQVTRCRAGWPLQEFVFTDETQEKWSLSNADGLPLYLLFFASWSPSSLKEMLVLERWQEKFRGRIQFVAVCMDDDYRNYRKYLEENLKLPIKLVYGNAEPFVQEKFNLKAIPHQVLLDAKGLVVADVCPAPSDPLFEAFLNRVAAASVPNRQGTRTWKDR
jgi:thiol-disulfide isomerase/thioredoxin